MWHKNNRTNIFNNCFEASEKIYIFVICVIVHFTVANYTRSNANIKHKYLVSQWKINAGTICLQRLEMWKCSSENFPVQSAYLQRWFLEFP